MIFNSVDFMIFLPVVCILYFVIPDRGKNIWLLAASYYFYMCWDYKYSLLLLISTVVTYAGGLAVARFREKSLRRAKLAIAVTFAVNLGILGYFKYLNFLFKTFERVAGMAGITFQDVEFCIVLPVGISFFTFQALSYIMDVYRGDVEVEKNFVRYALFVSFFPQLVAGPIERSRDLLPQLKKYNKFSYDRTRSGLLLIGWGLFLKLVVADRIAIYVDLVYDDPVTWNGLYIVLATVLFAFQIYADFCGYSTIAVGAAEILGYQLTENFKSPYCSVSVKEFWRRWHISLNRWFREYLYIPLGGNRKGKYRKYANLFVVFFLSGLWHGASWAYVVWGLLNWFYIVMGEILQPLREFLKKKLQWKSEAAGNKILSAFMTFCLVDFSWLFFRASNMRNVLFLLKNLFTEGCLRLLWDKTLYFYILQEDMNYIGICILLILIVDLLHCRGFSVRKWILDQNLWCRWLIYFMLVMAIIVTGIWGPSYPKEAFIYFQF